MNKVYIDDDTFIFKGTLDIPIDNKKFLSKVKTIYHIFPQFILTSDSSYTPTDEPKSISAPSSSKGQWISLVTSKFSTDETKNIHSFVVNFLCKEYNLVDDYVFHSWVLFADNKDDRSYYHDHLDINGISNQWSMCYYIQMPDNLSGDQGKLMFKSKTEKELGILPKEGDVIIFPGNLLHTPLEASNSTKDRVVFCSNFSFIPIVNRKVEKSIL